LLELGLPRYTRSVFPKEPNIQFLTALAVTTWLAACGNSTPSETKNTAKASEDKASDSASNKALNEHYATEHYYSDVTLDMFQQWAVCAAVDLPRAGKPTDSNYFDYGRLRLSDSSWVPWLNVRTTFYDRGPSTKDVEAAIKSWIGAVKATAADRDNSTTVSRQVVIPAQSIGVNFKPAIQLL
jgi:hypothetical protein